VSFRDRFFRRSTADLMMGPAGIIAAGAGTAVGILAGLPIIGAIGAGALAWGARVLIGLPKDRSGPNLNTRGLRDPWRRYATEAVEARREFGRAVEQVTSGAVRERMTSIAGRIDHGVEAIFGVANRAQTLEDARMRIDVARAATDLSTLRADPSTPSRPSLVRTMESLEAQLDTAKRLDAQVYEARENLALLDARLDEAVARGIELSVHRDADLSTLDQEIDDMVLEMEALRQALDATEAAEEDGTTAYG